MLVKVNSENTASGNPRRGWIHLDNEGRFVKFYAEGYDDGGKELQDLKKIEFESPLSLNITPKEYKRISNLTELGK